MKLSIISTRWIWLATVNSLLALGWGLSLVHYTSAVELGGRELFAFHVAVCLLALQNIKKQNKIIKAEISTQTETTTVEDVATQIENIEI